MYCLYHIIEQWGCSSNEEHVNITNLGSSWYQWCYCAQHFSDFLCPRQFLRFTTVSPTLHMFSTMLITHPTVIISDPTESRPQNHAHDRRIASKAAAVVWYFFPRAVLNAFLHNLIFKWIMDLNTLRLEAFVEGFIYTIQINRPCLLRRHQ